MVGPNRLFCLLLVVAFASGLTDPWIDGFRHAHQSPPTTDGRDFLELPIGLENVPAMVQRLSDEVDRHSFLVSMVPDSIKLRFMER